jgi:hypothetical protein
MREFKALNPKNLPDKFDLEVHTEEPIVEVKESVGKITISYAFPGFYLVDDNREVAGKKMELKQIHIKSTGFFTESGKPLLPSFGRYVQIPHNCDFKVTVQKSQPIQFDGILVSPAQTQLSDNPEQKYEFEYDKEFYAKDVLYPEELVKVTGPFLVDQYRALLVHVAPLQYNPAKIKVIGYGNITVTITLKEKTGDETKQTTGSLIDNEGFGNLLLNPGQRIADRVGFKISPVIFKATGPALLIIYAKIFEKAALKLADWKNHRGLLTEIICIDTIGNDVSKLKTYIRGRRSELCTRLRYVLLFGDTDMITPEKNLSTKFGPGTGTSDYYYSTRYDEHSPDPGNPNSILFYPWLAIGRIPVRPDIEGPPASGDSKAQGVVDQIIAYEKNPPADPIFYKRQVFAAAFEDDSHPLDHRDDRGYLRTIEELRSAIASLGYTTERVYVSNDPNLQYYDDGTNIPADVRAAVVNAATGTQMLIDATTEGQLYIGHRDHGNWDGWINPSFKNSDLDQVTGNMPSIFYSINCQTGRFDYPEPTECFAEKNLRMMGTAPSLIAATRNSGTFLNNDLIRAIFDATFGGVLPTFPGGNASYPVRNNRLGDILNYGKSYLPVANSGNPSGVKDHFQIYHVIGDPTLELWKDLPLVITIKTKIIIQKALDIQLSTCPNGAVMTIWYGAKMLKRMEPTSNHITIPLKGLVPVLSPRSTFLSPALMVCFWAPGYRYTAMKVAIA